MLADDCGGKRCRTPLYVPIAPQTGKEMESGKPSSCAQQVSLARWSPKEVPCFTNRWTYNMQDPVLYLQLVSYETGCKVLQEVVFSCLYCSTHLAAQSVKHDGTQLAGLLHSCLEVVQGAPVILNGSPSQIKPKQAPTAQTPAAHHQGSEERVMWQWLGSTAQHDVGARSHHALPPARSCSALGRWSLCFTKQAQPGSCDAGDPGTAA